MGGDERALYQKSRGQGRRAREEGEGGGRAIATPRGSWAPRKPAAPSHVLQPALGGEAGPAPRAGGRRGKAGPLLGKAPGQVSRSRKCASLETSLRLRGPTRGRTFVAETWPTTL